MNVGFWIATDRESFIVSVETFPHFQWKSKWKSFRRFLSTFSHNFSLFRNFIQYSKELRYLFPKMKNLRIEIKGEKNNLWLETPTEGKNFNQYLKQWNIDGTYQNFSFFFFSAYDKKNSHENATTWNVWHSLVTIRL